MNITDFIAACDRFCAQHNVTRVWLSKRLLADTYKLDNLAAGKVDIGVRRLEQAFGDLASLESERQQTGEAA